MKQAFDTRSDQLSVGMTGAVQQNGRRWSFL